MCDYYAEGEEFGGSLGSDGAGELNEKNADGFRRRFLFLDRAVSPTFAFYAGLTGLASLTGYAVLTGYVVRTGYRR